MEAVIDGKAYPINADFRDVLNILSRLGDAGEDEQTRVFVALALFYEGFEGMPDASYREAAQRMFDFISCGEPADQRTRPKTIDWDQDRNAIIADINKAAGREIRALHFCHWWTFISWFNAIGDGTLATIVSIREKLRRGKRLSEWENEFYRANRKKVDFQSNYTREEEETLNKWVGK